MLSAQARELNMLANLRLALNVVTGAKSEVGPKAPSIAESISSKQSFIRMFPQFSKLPTEIRLKIWRYAADQRHARITCIQPYAPSAPSLLSACHESRNEVIGRFDTFVVRSDKGKTSTMYFEHGKDGLYLNRRLMMPSKLGLRQTTVLHAALDLYPSLFERITKLAINLELMQKLTSAYRGGVHDIWAVLSETCPKLETLYLILHGPVRPDTPSFKFEQWSPEYKFSSREGKLVAYTIASFMDAREEGLCKSVHIYFFQVTPLPWSTGLR